jgi:hypothetical protein
MRGAFAVEATGPLLRHTARPRVGVLGEVGEHDRDRSNRTMYGRPNLIRHGSQHDVGLAASNQAVALCDVLNRTGPDISLYFVAALEAKPVSTSRTDTTQHQIIAISEAAQLGGVRLESVPHGTTAKLAIGPR